MFIPCFSSKSIFTPKREEEEEKEERKSLFKNKEVNVLKLEYFQVRGMKLYAQLQIEV